MGDVHFAIRHGLTGFIFLIFVLLGIWTVTDWSSGPPADWVADRKVRSFAPILVTLLITVFLSTPVIGVMVQGLYTAGMYAFGRAFKDEAREEIARHVREEVMSKPIPGMDDKTRARYQDTFRNIPADSLFVWLYYTDNQAHLVDWARRRRSYHYLGVNWVIAAVLGLAFGLILPSFFSWEKWLKLGTVLVISLAWAAGTLWLAGKMKRDVDCMELTWACARVYPHFKESVYNAPTVQQSP